MGEDVHVTWLAKAVDLGVVGVIADQRPLIFLRKTMCRLIPFSVLCADYVTMISVFRALADTYNVNFVHASSSYIKFAVWMSFVDSL